MGTRSAYLLSVQRIRTQCQGSRTQVVQPKPQEHKTYRILCLYLHPPARHLLRMRSRVYHSLPLLFLALSTACSPLYVIRAGFHEAQILSRRRPITRVIEDPATTPGVRRKLELVLQARAYAEHTLDL